MQLTPNKVSQNVDYEHKWLDTGRKFHEQGTRKGS